MIDDLKDIPTYLEKQGKGGVDLMLIHLGGTTLPSPSAPLLMVTMDAKQGLELVRLIQPDVTVPIHYEYANSSFCGLNGRCIAQFAGADFVAVTMMCSCRLWTTSRKLSKKLGSRRKWCTWTVGISTSSK